MKQVLPHIAVLRPLNSFMAAAAVVVGSVIDPNSALFDETIAVLLLSLSAFLITSGGNILNDLNDLEIDRKGHPDRPIARGALSERSARGLLGVLWPFGVICACFASLIVKASIPILIVMVSVIMIILYERKLKSKGLSGNVVIGILTGTPFLLGASIDHISIPVMSIFAMAAFSNISREITKDIQDLNIDRGHRSTLPLRIGKRNAILVSGSAMIFSILISPVPMILNRPDIVYIAGILVADLILAISIIMIREQPRRSQNIAKLGMFMAAIAFFLWSIG